MRVLMFGWEFPPHITGGLGTACFGLTKGLLKQGLEILFVVPKAYGDENKDAIRLINASDILVDVKEPLFKDTLERFSYLEIGSNLVPYLSPEEYEKEISQSRLSSSQEQQTVLSRKYEFSGKYGSRLMEEVSRYALVAASIAREYEHDLIHAHDWLTYAAGVAAKNASGKPLVVHMHATEFDRSGEKNVNTQVYELERSGMAAADRVISVSNLTRTTVIEKYHINPSKVFTVHNAVEPIDSGFSVNVRRNVDEKVVTFLGRLTFQKGPEYFVEAARKVLEKNPNVRFVMAGTGDMMNKLIRRVAALKMSTHFHFTGFLKGDDVDRMFGMSDVFVMPSVSEPFGIVPLEAMRSNVPVVISKQSGVAEILVHALKVDFWDVDALADSIYGLLKYNGLSEMFKKYGKGEVDSLKWENAALKVKEVYQNLLAENAE